MFAINPMQVARYRERHSTSGATSDAGDAHMLADMVRTDAHQLRGVAGDSDHAEAIPAALEAFPDLSAPDALELLAAAPDPAAAATLSRTRIAGAGPAP